MKMSGAENEAHDGAGYMASESYINYSGGLTPDNWLVSPQFSLNGVLKVWMKGQDANDFQEHVAIYVSTTSNDVAGFTDIVLPETIVTNEYVEYIVNLSQYAGAQGYIAIRHFNCTDQFHLNVDDFGLYEANSPSDEWQEIDASGTTAVITDLHPGSFYAYQVVGIVDEASYPSAIAVLQTEEVAPKVTQVSVAPQQTTAQVNWEGYGDNFNVRYAVDNSTTTARVTLTAGDVWSDGTGYQMLLDADANTFGGIIPEINPLTNSGNASAEVYAAFEYKIPEKADGALNTQNIVLNKSVTIDIPAGTYDWCITNPSPESETMFIASFHGNVGGRQDDYVFEAGKHYVFTVRPDGDYDRVDVEVTPMYGEWTQVAVENGAHATELTELTKNTKYVVQVQAVANGKTSEWSPVETFTTLGEGEIALYDNLDNQGVIDNNDGKVVDVTLQGRTLWKDGSWNTLCLPFNTELTGDLAGATLMELDTEGSYKQHKTGFEDGSLYLNFKSATSIEAGKPYIVKWETTGNPVENPVFNDVAIVKDAPINVTSKDNGEGIGNVTFVGTYSPVDIYTSDKTNLYLGAGNTLYYPWGDGVTSFKVNAFRAYFQLNNGLVCGEPDGQTQGRSINAFVLRFGDEETMGIASHESGVSSPLQQTWYSVDGRRLNGKPVSKGIYITNGRKIVIK